MSTVQHLINGELVAADARTADVFNPSTGQAIHKVALASKQTVQQAIDSAKAAFPAWRNTPPAKRAQVMFRFKQLLEQNEARISQLISEEHGKTLEDAAGELKRGIENVEFACAAPEVLKGEYSRNVGPNIDAWSISSRWAWWPVSPRSTSRPWCRCGCTHWRLPAVTASSSNRRSVTRARLC